MRRAIIVKIIQYVFVCKTYSDARNNQKSIFIRLISRDDTVRCELLSFKSCYICVTRHMYKTTAGNISYMYNSCPKWYCSWKNTVMNTLWNSLQIQVAMKNPERINYGNIRHGSVNDRNVKLRWVGGGGLAYSL